MSNYNSYIKKMTKILMSSSVQSEIDKKVDTAKKQDVKIKKRIKKDLIELSESEKKEITDMVDWHEYIDPPVISESEEE